MSECEVCKHICLDDLMCECGVRCKECCLCLTVNPLPKVVEEKVVEEAELFVCDECNKSDSLMCTCCGTVCKECCGYTPCERGCGKHSTGTGPLCDDCEGDEACEAEEGREEEERENMGLEEEPEEEQPKRERDEEHEWGEEQERELIVAQLAVAKLEHAKFMHGAKRAKSDSDE